MGDSRMTSSTMDDVFYWVKLFTKVLKIYFYSFSQQLKTIFFCSQRNKGNKIATYCSRIERIKRIFFLGPKRVKTLQKTAN